MNRKTVVFLVVITVAIVGIAYGSTVMNNQPAQPPTPTSNCKPEDLAGNFTSSPEMNDTSSRSFNVTFYIQNLGSQSANITEYTDSNGLTQRVNWNVPASATKGFNTSINKPEDNLMLKTSCGTSFTAQVYYPPPPIVDQSKHYEVTLYVSLGGAAS